MSPSWATVILGLLILLPVPTDVHAQTLVTFGRNSYSFSVTENFGSGSRPAVTIGTVTATQSGQTITYSLEGPDADRFSINASTGALTTKAGKAVSYENGPLYVVFVKATGNGFKRVSAHIHVPNVRRTASRTLQETYGHEREKTARNVGTPIPAVTGSTTETFTYSIVNEYYGGAFQIDASSGQLKTKPGREPYNYEAGSGNALPFYLRVTDSDGVLDRIWVTVNVTDRDEPAREIGGPCATEQTATSLTVKWGAGDINGYPRTESYDLRYRRGAIYQGKAPATPPGPWTNGEQAVPRSRRQSTISGLDPGTYYEVSIRPTNDEGTGDWSTENCGTHYNTTLSEDAVGRSGELSLLSVSDAVATEGTDTHLNFVVDLAPQASAKVSVDYATSDGTATAGDDYEARNGQLSFDVGETTKTIAVPIIDDVVEDDGETVRLVLSNPSGAELGRSEAVGTIHNTELDPLTAAFSSMPASHDGSAFTFTLTFSEHFRGLSYKTLKNSAFNVTGGSVKRARRQTRGSNESWDINVEPDGHGAVSIVLPQTTNCDATGAICARDGRMLSNESRDTVGAPPVGISVADARVDENSGALLAFLVTLSRGASEQLTVDYATSDGSAQAASDYTTASGTLTFQAGERSQTVNVTVLDDQHDEGEETLTLTLSNPSSGQLTDADATGTIVNADPLPRALVARFGRTAAVHVVEHVEERLAAPREPGVRGEFAGRELRRGMERDFALGFLQHLGGAAGANPMGGGIHDPLSGAPAAGAAALAPGLGGVGRLGAAGPMGGLAGPGVGLLNGGGLLQMGLGGGDMLAGSAFSLNRQTRQGGILSFWSRGAQSHFAGREGALSLGGDVRTTMFGADYAKGPVVAGLSLSHSRGLGEYAGVAGGQVASAVTGLYPWLGYKATDRITVWGVGGYGVGGMLLTPQGGPALESGLSMAMAAAGTRGELVAGGAGGFELAFKADALWVGTSIDGVDGPAGRLKATEAAVTRFRTGLEGSRDYTLAGRLSLRPSVEVGLRHDGGDAETGAGMDVGGGLVVSDAATGLAVDVRVRTLLVHQAEGFSERGVSVSLSYNPRPSTPLGFVARVAPSWGGEAASGAEALWGRETMAGMAHGGLASGNRLDADVGYGLPVGSRFVGTPRFGVGTSEYGRDYRLGYSLGALGGEGTKFELGVDAQRRESPLQGGTDHGALARATMRW